MPVNQATFRRIGRSICDRIPLNGNGGVCRDFRALFGASPATILDVWQRSELATMEIQPKHLMWACMFAKVYASESVHATLVGVTRKTFRKWVWLVIPEVAEIYSDVVSMDQFLLCHGGGT